MKAGFRRRGPFWRAPEARLARPELWLAALAVVGMLLVEVWQSARMAELCVALTHGRKQFEQEESRLAFERAGLERGASRAALAPLAAGLDLRPMDTRQIVQLPASFLAAEPHARVASAQTRPWLDRMARALVPEAIARSRSGH